MKRIITCALALFSSLSFGTTLSPITLLNPAGSTAGQVISSTGPSSAPAWAGVTLGSVTGTLAVNHGGTGVSSASGTALDNITGFSSTGFMTRTGANTYAFQSLTNGITLGNLAQAAANTILANGTGSTANITALGVPSCSASGNTLQWTSGTGFTCATGYALLASPTFTGTPAAPTATAGTNTTQIATTAFVTASPTINTPTINGITSGASAAAGVVGELKTNTGSGVSMSSGTAITCTSVALTAGKWLVWGNVSYTAAGSTTVSFLSSSISQTNNTGGPNASAQTINASFVTGGGQTLSATPVLLNISSGSTAYVIGLAFFGVSTMTCGGTINALRIL